NGFGTESEIHISVGDPVTDNIVQGFMGKISPSVGSSLSFNDTAGFHILAARFAGLTTTSPTVQIFLDGAAGPVVTGTTPELVNWSGVTRMARPGLASRFFSGDVAEACVFNAAAWGANHLVNQAKLAAYAKAKYALN